MDIHEQHANEIQHKIGFLFQANSYSKKYNYCSNLFNFSSNVKVAEDEENISTIT